MKIKLALWLGLGVYPAIGRLRLVSFWLEIENTVYVSQEYGVKSHA